MELICLSRIAQEDIARLRKENPKLAAKVWDLVISTLKTPFSGLGKPEALKGDLQGCWSRRIDHKHRIVYRIVDDVVEIISCYGHYSDK